MKHIQHFYIKGTSLSINHLSPIRFEGVLYPSVAHAFNAARTLDPHLRLSLCRCDTEYSYICSRQFALRPNWMDIRVDIMETLLHEKYRVYPELKDELLETTMKHIANDEVIEDDHFWDHSIQGKNALGDLLAKLHYQFWHANFQSIPQQQPLSMI